MEPLIALVIVLALVEYMGFALATGRARLKYEVAAPATTGNEQFERHFRAQQNTLEQLIAFIPALIICGMFSNVTAAAVAGLVFITGRLLYYRGYVKEPKSRSLGFGLGFFAMVYLLIASLVGVVGAML